MGACYLFEHEKIVFITPSKLASNLFDLLLKDWTSKVECFYCNNLEHLEELKGHKAYALLIFDDLIFEKNNQLDLKILDHKSFKQSRFLLLQENKSNQTHQDTILKFHNVIQKPFLHEEFLQIITKELKQKK